MKLPGYNTLQLIFSSALTVLPQNLHRSPVPGLRQVASGGEPLTRVLAGKPTTPLNRRPHLNKPAVEVPTEFLSQFSLYRFLHQLTFRCHPHSEDCLSLTCLELRSLRPASLPGLHRKEEFSLSVSPAPVDVLEGKIQDILQAVPRELRCRQTTYHRNITPCKEPVSEASRWGAPPPRVLCEEPWRSWLPSPPIYPPRSSRTETRHLIHALEQLAVSECRRLTIDLNSANERL